MARRKLTAVDVAIRAGDHKKAVQLMTRRDFTRAERSSLARASFYTEKRKGEAGHVAMGHADIQLVATEESDRFWLTFEIFRADKPEAPIVVALPCPRDAIKGR